MELKSNIEIQLTELLTRWRNGIPELAKYKPGITEVFLAALGINGERGFQCEIGFGDATTKSFQSETLEGAISLAYCWAAKYYE